MIISCNMVVDRSDHVQDLTVSKSYSDNCTLSQSSCQDLAPYSANFFK